MGFDVGESQALVVTPSGGTNRWPQCHMGVFGKRVLEGALKATWQYVERDYGGPPERVIWGPLRNSYKSFAQ